VEALGVDIAVLWVVGCPVELAASVATSLWNNKLVRTRSDMTVTSYLNFMAPERRVELFKLVVHDKTSLRYLGLLDSGVRNVTTDSHTDEDEAKCDPVTNLGSLHPRVVLPWQLTPSRLVRLWKVKQVG
jgi:hypothetical protein